MDSGKLEMKHMEVVSSAWRNAIFQNTENMEKN
jgi:hypothetical protein